MEEKQKQKTIYLHIGQPKTGTSSMQRYCYANRELLKEQGLIYELMPYQYPKVGIYRNAHFLCAEVKDEKDQIIEGAKAERIREALGIVEGYLKQDYSVLLTDERLWNYLYIYDYDTLKILMDFAKEQGARLKVIMYLRPQDGWIISLYHQHIREGLICTPWDEYIRNVPRHILLDYALQCDNLSALVGKENLVIRVYDRKLFPEGKVELDFLSAIDIQGSDAFKPLAAENNPSLSNNFAELTRMMNPLIMGGLSSDSTNRIFEKAGLKCSERFPDDPKTDLLSEEHRKLLEERYGESNRRLSETYLSGMKFELSGSKGLPAWEARYEDQIEDVFLYLGSILLEQKREIKKLKEEVEKLKKETRWPRGMGRELNRIEAFLKGDKKA